MARRRKPTPVPDHQFKIRLPGDIADRVAKDAKAEARPMNRIIINDLAAIPRLKESARLASLVDHMEVIVARYGARITWHDLSDELLNAVDAVLAAQGGALQGTLDKLRVVRRGMLAHEKLSRNKK
jgi:Arc-like DNA binding domain